MPSETLSPIKPHLIHNSTVKLLMHMQEKSANMKLMATLISVKMNYEFPDKYSKMHEVYHAAQDNKLTKKKASEFLDIFSTLQNEGKTKEQYLTWKRELLKNPTRTRSILANIAIQGIISIFYDKDIDLINVLLDKVIVNPSIGAETKEGKSFPIHLTESGFAS